VLRVAIVEDQNEIREGLRLLIDDADGYSSPDAFGSAEEILRRLPAGTPKSILPNVVLMDIGLPGASGIEATQQLKERFPELVIVVLTVYEDDDRIFEAICAGASGYLLKKTPATRLLEGIQEAATGGAPMSPEVATRVIQLFRRFRPAAPATHGLTPHEVRLLRLLVDGHNYKTAAGELGVSVNTIAFHMKHIYEKLHVHSKSEAVSKALRTRILS
jgi:DNA-binding NarL/FixJ family response regulator